MCIAIAVACVCMCGMCMYVLHVHLCLCVSVACGQRVYQAIRDYVCILFFVHKCVRVCICFVYVGGYVCVSTWTWIHKERYLVSNGIRGSTVSLMVLYKEMIIL